MKKSSLEKSCIAILYLLANIFLFSGCDYKSEIAAIKSLRKITDGVYYIEYQGDYKLDEYINAGGGNSNDKMSNFISKCLKEGSWTGIGAGKNANVKITSPEFGCSSIAAKNSEGGKIYGRNYDWNDCSIIIVHTKPENAYESISTSCLDFLGCDRNWKPAYKFPDDMITLASIYVPLDGINEKGLYIADLMAGDKQVTAQNTEKPDLTTTAAIRMILDKAANIDEAIKLLEKIDMYSVIESAHHFAIADSSGRSVVVEYVDNKMYVTESPVLTNHYTCESPCKDDGSIADRENSRIRFDELLQAGENHNWIMDAKSIQETMESVSAKNYSTEQITAWSIVFEAQKRKLTYCFRNDFNNQFVVEF